MLAITLLIAFGLPLVQPLFAATVDPEASLPACCRGHGAHHCAMMHQMLAGSSGPSFQAPPCPFYPAPSTAPQIGAASLAAQLQLSLEQFRNPAPPALKQHVVHTFSASSNLKRGPPLHIA